MKLPKTSNKAIIVDRFVQAMQNDDASPTPNRTQVPTTPSSQWELQQPSTIPAQFTSNSRFTDPSGNN